jgi:hypothetical protein
VRVALPDSLLVAQSRHPFSTKLTFLSSKLTFLSIKLTFLSIISQSRHPFNTRTHPRGVRYDIRQQYAPQGDVSPYYNHPCTVCTHSIHTPTTSGRDSPTICSLSPSYKPPHTMCTHSLQPYTHYCVAPPQLAGIRTGFSLECMQSLPPPNILARSLRPLPALLRQPHRIPRLGPRTVNTSAAPTCVHTTSHRRFAPELSTCKNKRLPSNRYTHRCAVCLGCLGCMAYGAACDGPTRTSAASSSSLCEA